MSASTRPIKLDEWGISWEEYKELTYFCLQYNRKKADAAALLTIKLSTPTPAIYHKKVGDKLGFTDEDNALLGSIGRPMVIGTVKREDSDGEDA